MFNFNKLIRKRFNNLCPNCMQPFTIRNSRLLHTGLGHYDCYGCDITLEVKMYSCHINYNKLSISIDLQYDEIIINPENPRIQGVPKQLDTQSVLNFIAIYETFQ